MKVKDPKDPAKEIDKDVSTCFEQCGSFPENPTAGQKARGLYRITPESCGDCNELCLNCDGDKFNCTKCDVDLKLALFQKKMLIGG